MTAEWPEILPKTHPFRVSRMPAKETRLEKWASGNKNSLEEFPLSDTTPCGPKVSKQSNGHGPGELEDQPFFTSAGGTVVDVDPEILGFNKVEFTKHCLQQMRDRGISEDEVLRTIRGPQRKGLPTSGRRERWRRHRGIKRATDVVFEKLDDRIRVITAIVVDLD